MVEVRAIIKSVSDAEKMAEEVKFIAPVTLRGRVRVRVSRIIYALKPRPEDFSGWGVFLFRDGAAELVEPASLPLITRYCKLLLPVRVRFAHVLQGSSWLAYPVNELDARTRLGKAAPIVVHLVEGARAFDVAVVRLDAGSAWFERVDRRANPRTADMMRELMKEAVEPAELRFPGLTPEMRTAYRLAALSESERFAGLRRERETARLEAALSQAGGQLREFTDRGDFWQVDWTTSTGERHFSAVAKRDLTVLSSGICLSGRDRDFDLQSLVGVIERRGEDWY